MNEYIATIEDFDTRLIALLATSKLIFFEIYFKVPGLTDSIPKNNCLQPPFSNLLSNGSSIISILTAPAHLILYLSVISQRLYKCRSDAPTLSSTSITSLIPAFLRLENSSSNFSLVFGLHVDLLKKQL